MKVVLDTNILVYALEVALKGNNSSDLQKNCLQIIRLGKSGKFQLIMVSQLKMQYEKIWQYAMEHSVKYDNNEIFELFDWVISGSFGRLNVDLPVTTNIKDGLLFHGHLIQADFIVTNDYDVIKMNERLNTSRKALLPDEFLKVIGLI